MTPDASRCTIRAASAEADQTRMEPAVRVGSLRRIIYRAGLVLGLTGTLLISPGAFPAPAPVAAQDQEATPDAAPDESAPPADTTPASAPKPQPAGPPPAFKPS